MLYQQKGKLMPEDRLDSLDREVAEFIAKINQWMETTNEYRRNLCSKIDNINDKFADLPCKERGGWYQAINKQISMLWVFVTAIVLTMVGMWFKK